jgi:hypothetical protein
LYSGIDCNAFFPELLEAWQKIESTSVPVEVTRTNPVHVAEVIRKELEDTSSAKRVLEGDDEDRPPVVEFCLGREGELQQLKETNAKVILITGIGGQGKSTLAAQYFSDLQRTHRFKYFIWRDCKEESERFENQLASLLETLSMGKIAGVDLAKQDHGSLIQLLLTLTRDVEVLFVFDNVDHYVSLDGTLTAIPDLFVSKLLSSDSQAQVVLTCRPSVTYDHPLALTCNLDGLSIDAVSHLFTKRGAKC